MHGDDNNLKVVKTSEKNILVYFEEFEDESGSSPCCGHGWKASRLPEIGKEKPGQCVGLPHQKKGNFVMVRTCCDGHVHCKNCDMEIRSDHVGRRNDYGGRCRAASDNGVTLENLESCVVQGCEARSDREDFVES